MWPQESVITTSKGVWKRLQLAFLLSSFFLHSGCLLFPPRHYFQLLFPDGSAHLTSLPVSLRAQTWVWPVQSSEHCEDCPFLSDCSGPEMMSTWCCLRSSSLLHPFFRRLPVPQLLGLTWTSIVVWELLLACFSPGLRQHSATPQAPHSSPVGTYQVPLAKWLCVQYFQHPRMWGWGRLF